MRFVTRSKKEKKMCPYSGVTSGELEREWQMGIASWVPLIKMAIVKLISFGDLN